MTVETAVQTLNIINKDNKDRKCHSSETSAAICEEMKKSVLAAQIQEPPVAKETVTKDSVPGPAPNNGWGIFKDRETFVEMHLC